MHIRNAKLPDCADLAILDDIAGHGLTSHVWAIAAKGAGTASAFEFGRDTYRSHDTPCNWTNARIAEQDGELAGMAVGYRLPEDSDFSRPIHPLFAPVYRLFAKATGSWLLDALAVYTRHRGQGLARRLLADQVQRATGHAMALVCADDNAPALSLYAAHGFETAARAPFVAHGKPRNTREWLLLKRPAS